jgi:dihydroorotate dehydrogenase electron transfer subunit
MNREYVAVLLEKKIVGKGNALLTFSGKEIAARAEPGQFANISCRYFLKRPFGIYSVDTVNNTFTIGVRETGKGTKDILASRIGDTFLVLGPLGHGFDFDGISKIIVVGGGTGVFPLMFALEKAKARGIPTIAVNGFRGKEDAFLLDDCESLAGKACFTSDAGDFGIHGNVLSALDTLSSEDTSGAAVFAVGPEIMMRKVSEWAAERGLSCQVSLERRMACGIGICLVCVCKVKAEEKGIPFHHIRCCKEGPVMNASEVIW